MLVKQEEQSETHPMYVTDDQCEINENVDEKSKRNCFVLDLDIILPLEALQIYHSLEFSSLTDGKKIST